MTMTVTMPMITIMNTGQPLYNTGSKVLFIVVYIITDAFNMVLLHLITYLHWYWSAIVRNKLRYTVDDG